MLNNWKIFSFNFLSSITICLHGSAITYIDGSRFGDHLLALMHAEWISYKYDIPLKYRPFPYSDALSLHALRSPLDRHANYKKIVKFTKNKSIKFEKNSNILYVIPYFPESLEEHRIWERNEQTGEIKPKAFRDSSWHYFAVDWEDKVFKKRIQEIISPLKPLNLIIPPPDCLSVAVHVRRNGGGYDRPLLQGLSENQVDRNIIYADQSFPLKCAPHSYYLEQIKLLMRMFPSSLLYVFIFTDDPEPEKIAKDYIATINDSRVIFDYRKTENNHYSNVLEDFFSMLNFDCLIRPDSNLSIAASKIGDFKVVISPVNYRWESTNLIIDKISLSYNTD